MIWGLLISILLDKCNLYQDCLYAVFPNNHPLAKQSEVSLTDLAETELILLDEGENSLTRAAFAKENLTPTFTYEIYDDYTILEMIRQDLGASLLYENFLDGLSLQDLSIRHITEKPFRTIVLAWKNWQTLPLAAQQFAKTFPALFTTNKKVCVHYGTQTFYY